MSKKAANILIKREAQKASIQAGLDGTRLYQFTRQDSETGETFNCTLDQKRFEAYCENHGYEYRIETRADGTEYALFALKQTVIDYPKLFEL